MGPVPKVITNITGISYKISETLQPLKKYYWTVSAATSKGQSAAASPYSFKVMDPAYPLPLPAGNLIIFAVIFIALLITGLTTIKQRSQK